MPHRSVFSVIISYLLLGCVSPELVDNIPLPEVSPKVVVYASLTPADSIRIYVSWAYPIESNRNIKQAGISDAQVTLTQNSGSLTLSPGKQAGYYSASQRNFPVTPGQSYQLQIKVPNQPTVSANCTVPKQKALFSNISTQQISPGEWQISKKWKGVSVSEDTLGYAIAEYSEFISEFSTQPIVSRKLYDQRTIRYINNEYFEDTIIYYDPEILKQYNTPYIFYLITLDTNLVRFLQMSRQMNDALDNGESTFLFGFRGIVPEFTNIKNGLGVFGAYQTAASKPVYLK